MISGTRRLLPYDRSPVISATSPSSLWSIHTDTAVLA